VIFFRKRKTKLRDRKQFYRSKVWIALYTVGWVSLVYVTYAVLDVSLLLKVLITVVLVLFAPTLGDLTESYEEYKKDKLRFLGQRHTQE